MKFFSTLTAVVLFLLASVVSADLDHNPEGAGWTELVADAEGNCYLQFTDWGTEGFKCNVRTERIGIVDHATYTCKSIGMPVPITDGKYASRVLIDSL